MPQPPDHEHGDADELARRRALRGGPDSRTPEEALRDAEQRLGAVAAERDALRGRLTAVERELTGTRQREWAEQQQRVEAEAEAAGARELAAGQVADLRQRLSLAEAELANAAAERDRAVEDVRRETARREALEAREGVLRQELVRRTELATRAGGLVDEARDALVRQRTTGPDTSAIEARLARERAAFAQRVAAVEAAVAAVRDRLPAAARALHQRLADERAGRIAAESALAVEREASRRARMEAAWLEGELARRAEAEAQLRQALDELRAELDAARLGDDERERRLSARIEDVQAIAGSLRAGVEQQRAAEHQALSSALERMQEHLAELQAHAASAAASVRDELEAERAARAAAEARIGELEAEVDELRRTAAPTGPDPEALASLRAALEHLRGAEAAPADPAVAQDLAAAARRLREGAEAPAPEHPAESAESETSGAEEPAAAQPDVPGTTVPGTTVPGTSVPGTTVPGTSVPGTTVPGTSVPGTDVPGTSVPGTSVPGTTVPGTDVPRQRHTLPARGAVARPGPWLRDALLELAGQEPEVAELVVVALLGAQTGIARATTTYDLAITGGGTHRVTLEPAAVRVDRPSDDAREPDARIAGRIAALVPLAAGGAARRLPGADIRGRWTLRRLLKARREPLSLTALASSQVAIAPGLLLTLLASAVPAAATSGEALTVDVAAEGSDRWRIATRPTGGLSVEPAPEQPAPATLHTTAARLPAVLAGTAPAEVEGDQRAVRTLLAWLDRAQRADR